MDWFDATVLSVVATVATGCWLFGDWTLGEEPAPRTDKAKKPSLETSGFPEALRQR
jgi:hypothetical protein